MTLDKPHRPSPEGHPCLTPRDPHHDRQWIQAQHNTSAFTYDTTTGQGLSAADASGNEASVTRNGDGTVATSTTPAGAVTPYGYNTVGQLTSITPPAGTSLGKRMFSYDGLGRLASVTSGRGITTSYMYDAGDRATRVSYSDGTPAVSYAYDDAGQVKTRTDASGTTTYGYDPLGRLTSRSSTANAGGVSYGYDKAGNLASATNAAGTTTYAYDARNLPTSMTDPAGRVIRFAADTSGRRTDTWFDTNSAHTTFAAHTHTGYDASGRVTEVWTARASSDAAKISDVTYSYGYDTDGGSCTSTMTAGADSALRWVTHDKLTGVYTNYCYDKSNRLVLADPGDAGPTSYSYDRDGNRTKVAAPGGTVTQTLTFNPAHQITTAGYAYDADGNTTADGYGTETYNAAEQLISVTDTTGTRTLTYAGVDQTELITGGGRTYTYGRTSPTTGLPLVESFTADDGGSSFSYLYDPDGTPLAIEGSTAGSNAHYLALDPLHSVLATIRQDGTTTATYAYDPWGQQTAAGQNGSAIALYQLYGYAGGTTDPSYNGLEHLGHRWYDPTTGRFTQQDTIVTLSDPTRANRYEYADDNPTNYVDPMGRSTTCYSGPTTYCTTTDSNLQQAASETPLGTARKLVAACDVVAIASAIPALAFPPLAYLCVPVAAYDLVSG